MTYCLGVKVNEGLVLASDSRTNAGVDYVSVYSKMYRFEVSSDRIFVIVTSGNLSISQAVMQQVQRDIDMSETISSLATVSSVYDAATYLGRVSQMIQNQFNPGLSQSGINGESYFIIGGQIGLKPHELYLVYAQGNCISPSQEFPFLQIGETKYGKPVLDRVITPTTSIEDAARAALVSIDSTIRSNITVGPPVELAIICTNQFRITHYLKLAENDTFHKAIQQRWNEGLRNAFTNLPRFPWESRAPLVPSGTPITEPQIIPAPGEAPQPQELASQNWNQQQQLR
jgi:putative proteasome-type protease